MFIDAGSVSGWNKGEDEMSKKWIASEILLGCSGGEIYPQKRGGLFPSYPHRYLRQYQFSINEGAPLKQTPRHIVGKGMLLMELKRG